MQPQGLDDPKIDPPAGARGRSGTVDERDFNEVENDHQIVTKARPAAGYMGGKKQLAGRLAEMIAATPHTIYAEVFVGMGGVFFRRKRAPKVEAINDRDQEVANLFRILQRHFEAFADMLKWRLASRAEFDRLRAQDPATLTDLERAARFLYLQKLAFGGKVVGQSFGIDTAGPARFDVTKLGPQLADIHERLAGVWIECLDWRAFIARWDRPTTLFFCDPPYWGTENAYRAAFPPADHEALAATLTGIKGRFILTMADCPEARACYGRFRIEEAGVTYTAGGGGHALAAREIIVRSP